MSDESVSTPAPKDVSTRSEPATTARAPIGKWVGIGIGAGIGSAAIAAALLYTSGTRRKTERK